MSTPVHRTSTRQSVAVLPPTRQSRAGAPVRDSPDRPLLRIQSSLGNRAAVAAVQRARDTAEGKEPEKEPENGSPSTGSKSYRDRIAAVLDKLKKNLEFIDTFVKGVHVPANAGFSQQASATADEALKHSMRLLGDRRRVGEPGHGDRRRRAQRHGGGQSEEGRREAHGRGGLSRSGQEGQHQDGRRGHRRRRLRETMPSVSPRN